MKEIMQQTLAAPIAYSGIGLHSGKEVAMKLLPGKENTGIVFVRTDLSGPVSYTHLTLPTTPYV